MVLKTKSGIDLQELVWYLTERLQSGNLNVLGLLVQSSSDGCVLRNGIEQSQNDDDDDDDNDDDDKYDDDDDDDG